ERRTARGRLVEIAHRRVESDGEGDVEIVRGGAGAHQGSGGQHLRGAQQAGEGGIRAAGRAHREAEGAAGGEPGVVGDGDLHGVVAAPIGGQVRRGRRGHGDGRGAAWRL